MKRIEDIKKFEDIDTYYEISKIVEEVFQDRVETHKHLVTANKEIKILNNRISAIENQLQQKENIIKEVREWIRIVQTNEDRKHLEPIINTDELDHILEILDKVEE